MNGNNENIAPGVDRLIRGLWTTIALLSVLTGCGGGGGDSVECSVSPSPSIGGTPPTTATVGERYYYYADATLVCGSAIFIWSCSGIEPVQLPPGATASSSVVTWTPSSDWKNRTASFAINTREDACGNRASQSWTVRVLPDPTPPTVLSARPTDGATNVPTNFTIDVEFSEEVDPATVNPSSIVVTEPGGVVVGSLTVSGSTVSLTPVSDLKYSTTYSGTVNSGVRDVDGNALASEFTWSFETKNSDPDIVAPAAPTNVQAIYNSQFTTPPTIELSWDEATDDSGFIAGYRIYRQSALIAQVTTTITYSDTTIGTYAPYCYTITALDYADNESAPSTLSCATEPWRIVGRSPRSSANYVKHTAIATDSNDAVHMLYLDENCYYQPCHTMGWYVKELPYFRESSFVFYEAPVDSNVSLVVDSVDGVHRSFKDGDSRLWHQVYGGSSEIVGHNVVLNYLNLSGGPGDSMHLVTCEISGLTYWTNKSGSWVSEAISIDTVPGSCEIAVDSGGKVHVAYYGVEPATYKHVLRYVTNASGAWIAETVDDSSASVGTYASLGLDSNGKAHIAYYDGSNGDLKYASNSTGSWQIETIDSVGDVGRYAAIALDSNDNPHIAYTDVTNWALKYATTEGATWSLFTIDKTNYTGNFKGYTDIALDSHDKAHISYVRGRTIAYATNKQ